MITKKSNMIMLAVLLATLPMYALAGCKKKVQSVDAKSTEIFDEELPIRIETFGSEQSRQSDQLLANYSLSADDEEEYTEEPNDDEEEFDDEEEQDEEYDDEQQPEDEEDYDEDPNDYDEDDSDDYSDDEEDDSW